MEKVAAGECGTCVAQSGAIDFGSAGHSSAVPFLTLSTSYLPFLPLQTQASAEQAAALAALKREGGLDRQKVVVQGTGEVAEDLDPAAVALAAVRAVPGVDAEMVVTSGKQRISQLMVQVGR